MKSDGSPPNKILTMVSTYGNDLEFSKNLYIGKTLFFVEEAFCQRTEQKPRGSATTPTKAFHW